MIASRRNPSATGPSTWQKVVPVVQCLSKPRPGDPSTDVEEGGRVIEAEGETSRRLENLQTAHGLDEDALVECRDGRHLVEREPV